MNANGLENAFTGSDPKKNRFSEHPKKCEENSFEHFGSGGMTHDFRTIIIHSGDNISILLAFIY